MNICGYQKTTLLDYPGHVAATIFTGGCNFRCPFCHNSDLVIGNFNSFAVSEEEIYDFLKKRKKVLSGVCITGGEPTLQSDLTNFIKQVKHLGYKVKLDTNGYFPHIVETLLNENLLDYIAMDLKGGLSNYSLVTGISDFTLDPIRKSISLLENSGIDYEFRTTVVKQLHTAQDFYEIKDLLSSQSPYYLQSFQDSGKILTQGLSSCTRETMLEYLNIVQTKLPKAQLRGID